MKPSPELISALRRAADRIEDPNGGWNWYHGATCNCGILAQELGVPAKAMRGMGAWGWAMHRNCMATGQSLNKIFTVLEAAGVALADIPTIEDAGIQCYGIVQAQVVARYFRAQADLLEEQLQEAEKNLRQVGVERNATVGAGQCEPINGQQSKDEPFRERGGRITASSQEHLLQNPITAELAKHAPCSHLFLAMGDSCVLCGYIKPASAPVQVGGGV